MSVGRPKDKLTYELEGLFKIHIDKFVVNGKLLPPKNEIWSFLRDKLSVKKQEKVIYTAALKWYQNQNKAAENKDDIPEEAENVSVELNEASDTSVDSDFSSNDHSSKKCSKKFTITISPKVWRTIAPEEISTKRKREGSHKTGLRKYFNLERGLWTNIFANEIAKQDIPCRWAFKRNKCYVSGEKFLVFQAKCNTCTAVLIGDLKDEPTENEPVNIHIKVYEMNLERHTEEAKNVKLTSKVVQKICSQNKTATVISHNLRKESTQMFTEPTARIMSANAIRCATYRQRIKNKLSDCPITALSYLKSSNLFMNCIQRIGLEPFFVIYCTPEQKKLFQAFSQKNKTLKVSCDATGGIVHKLGKAFF